MTQQEINDYINFMYNRDNAYRCSNCPENAGFEDSPCNRCYPCGQQNCWVICHCNSVADHQD